MTANLYWVCKHLSVYQTSQVYSLQRSEIKASHERKQKTDGIWTYNNYKKNYFQTCDIRKTNAWFFLFSQQKERKNGNSPSLKISSINQTHRMKSNKIEYYICANIIYFIAKFQKVVFKNKGIYMPLLFSEYAEGVLHLDLCSHDMAGRNFHMSSISLNSEEMSLLNSREHTSVPDLAFSDPSYLHMIITF